MRKNNLYFKKFTGIFAACVLMAAVPFTSYAEIGPGIGLTPSAETQTTASSTASSGSQGTSPAAAPTVYDQAYFTREMISAFNETNAERENSGLKLLVWNEKSAAAADLRAKEAAQVFSHTRPDGSAWYTADPDTLYGENLARGYKTGKAAVAAWMQSPGHKANILNPEYTSVSFGYGITAKGSIVYSQEFSY